MSVLRRHSRFVLAFALGLCLWAASHMTGLDAAMRVLVAVNGFFLAYLLLMARLTARIRPEDLRQRAKDEDEGIALILALALGAVIVSLGAIVLVLDRQADSLAETVFALLAAPLGWAMLHVLAAFRYAHLYYAEDNPGLAFPDPAPVAPGAWDFLYFAFTVGMTAQTADVQATSPLMRRTVLLHAVGAFFYNTVILALAVNAAVSLGP